MTRPKYLYKYQPITIQTISNLKNRQIWFSKPAAFNDPFDCAIRVDTENIPEEDFDQLFKIYKTKCSNLKRLDNYLTNNKPNDLFKSEIKSTLASCFEEQKQTMLFEKGVACFSEQYDNLLMWSHYAQGHRGFCLEFDASLFPFNKAKKVNYLESIPQVSRTALVLGDLKAFDLMITTKAPIWSYEEEWRILHSESDIGYKLNINALKGVYLGPAINPDHKAIISMILKNSPTKLYELKRNNRNFKLECHRVS